MSFEEQISRLSKIKSNKYLISSLYLKLGPGERENFKYKITLKNLLRENKENLLKQNISREILEFIDSDFEKFENYFKDSNQLRSCRGVAIFSCSAERLWEVFKLPLVYRNRLSIDRAPLLGEIIKINEEYPNIPIVLIDRKKARFFNISPSGVEEAFDYFYPGASRTTKFQSPEGKFKQKVSPSTGGGQVSQGYGEYGFHRTIANEIQQHFKYVSDRLFDHYKENKFEWFILGGNDKAIKEFSQHLHTYLRDKLQGQIRVDIDNVNTDQLIEETLNLFDIKKNHNHKRLIKEFEEKISQGLSVNGLEATLKTLMKGQARIILISEGFSQPGFVCPESGFLVLKDRESLCPEGKRPVPVVDIVDNAIEDAFKQRVDVHIIQSEEARGKITGIGAILRFKS